MAIAPMPAAQALATLQAAGVNAFKSPARGRCRTLCYLVAGQYVNLGRLRELAREALEAQARVIARPTLPGEATPPPAPASLGDAAPALPPLPVAAPADRVAAHRAAAAAGRPVSLAALARDMGRSLGLPQPGRRPAPADRVAAQARALAADLLIPQPTPDSLRARAVIAGAEAARLAASGEAAPAQAAASHAETLTTWADSLADRPTGDAWAGQPWDPGTPEARARVADQGRIAARLHPIARAATGAGCTLPPSWWSDGPALNGELAPMRALEALPLPTLAAAAAALAALPPVTEAQAQGLAYCRAALRARSARL